MIGYVRVSTSDQKTVLQRDALTEFGVPIRNIFEDQMSGGTMRRPGLERAIRMCRKGDMLIVWKLDRLGRSVSGVLDAIETLDRRGVKLKSLTEPIDTTTPMGRMVMTILVALAEMERSLISERTKAGMAAAKARGTRAGRSHSILDYPKRRALFQKLHASKDLFEMTGRQIIDAMNAADPEAPPIKGPQMFYNWQANGFKGLPAEPDQPLEIEV